MEGPPYLLYILLTLLAIVLIIFVVRELLMKPKSKDKLADTEYIEPTTEPTAQTINLAPDTTAPVYEGIPPSVLEDFQIDDAIIMSPTEERVESLDLTPDTAVPVANAVTSPIPDNLQLIEGIGPKIAGILNQAGIYTYSDLANTSTDELDRVLAAAGLITGRSQTWSEQAKLANEGKREELAALQAQLRGGRKS